MRQRANANKNLLFSFPARRVRLLVQEIDVAQILLMSGNRFIGHKLPKQ
jgi:hypothetical protein